MIHDTLTHQPELHHWLHGEKAGFSLLLQSLLDNDLQQPDSQLLSLLRQFGTPLRLPALQGDRAARLYQIAHQIRFPAGSLDDLPFAVTSTALLRALQLTETTDYSV